MFPTELTKYCTIMDWSATGSRVIADPPPTNTDEDWVVLVDNMEYAKDILNAHGFLMDGLDLHYGHSHFRSFRKGELNLIVTESAKVYELYVLSTYVARRLNLTNKADRIRLFQTIREVGGLFRPPFAIPPNTKIEEDFTSGRAHGYFFTNKEGHEGY